MKPTQQPTVAQMQLALAKKFDKGGYVSVLERGDMSFPAYRAQLEKEQALENVYPETLLAPVGRGLSAAAKKAKALFESSKATGPLVTKPIGWNLQKSMDEMLGHTQPAPVVFNPRTADEISREALKKVPERLLKSVKENAPLNVTNSANDLAEIVRVYKEDQNKADGGRVKQPKSTVKAYKLFRVDPKKPGQLFPLFVDANTPVKMGKWVDAKSGEMKDGKVKSKIGALAYRPGWHAGDLPIATHIGEKSDPSLTAPDTRPDNHAWAEVEMPNDVDWQSEATKRGTNAQGKVVPVKAHITDQIPKGGHYRYKTNPNMTGNWLIGGSMKVNRVLDDDEVSRINSEAGLADLPRANPFDAKKFGFAGGGNVSSALMAPDEWKAEEYVNHMADGGTPKTPSVAQMKLALNKQGMYSPLEKAAMAVPRTKGTPAEFMAEASKQPGFRKEEVADRKISLPEQKMTKDEFLTHLKGHASPKLTEKVIGGDEPDEDNGYTQYEEYKLPGGTNYREVLLKTPTFPEAKDRQIMELEANIRRMDPADYAPGYVQNMIDGVAKLKAEKAAMGDSFQSTHWTEDPNVLAHIRLSDRFAGDTGKFAVEGTKDRKKRFLFSTGINGTREQAEEAAKRFEAQGYQTDINQVDGGKKLLHVEEIQSDWHQKGRKEGYYNPDQREEMKQALKAWKLANPGTDSSAFLAQNPQYAEMRNAAPDAPFKKSWHELAMKHILNHAANNGYDGIVITPGQEQANRYDMSKHVNDLQYDPQSGSLKAWDHSGAEVVNESGVPPEKLSSYIGKEGAQKLMSKPDPLKQLFGADLKIGGEGMKGFYDKIVPDYLNKLGKPHGAQVQMNAVPLTNTIKIDDYVHPSETSDVARIQGQSLHYFPITDTMRQQIKTEGLPQYQVGGIIHKAEGGNVQPSTAEMRMALAKHNPIELQKIGVNEAPNMSPKAFFSPEKVGGVGMPAPGGVDLNPYQPGQQLVAAQPQPQGGLPQQPGQPPQGDMAPPAAPAGPAGPTPPGGGNILQMTQQGRAMGAMGGQRPPAPGMPNLAKGGSAKSVEDMKAELAENKSGPQDKRVTIKADGPGGVKGLVVPRHTLEGNAKSGAVGLHEMNEARAKVYGNEHRPPLTLNKIAQEHRNTLKEHFAKPIEEQHEAEKAALQRLRDAKHIGKTANTLDESEKLDTVRHEHDEQGRTHIGFASKGVAGHALYTSGSGKDTKYHVINTCPGQTEGCGGGKDAEGIVDTKKGTCFAPNAESQYPGAATRRAAHAQAKHDPKMTNDWILAHTGSMRNAARLADKGNQRLLFRPNVVDETDVSSRHVIRHLNEQRKAEGKPDIIANSYGKTNELHDPENGYYVTHSNVGPKVKKGKEISENIGRDKARVRNTIMAADNKGDFTNEQGNKTPPKGSYMVTDVKRNSDMSKKMEKAITHAKYWSTGREEHELSAEEKAEGKEGHFGGNGKPTTPDKAHYGHTTVGDKRFDYQKQHIVHPRLVQVGSNKDGTPHMIPTDSRFKDTEFLPKNRFKTKNGKEAGHILMTTPTESTSNVGHQTSFTHHVNDSHIEHAEKNNGEYEIDKPEDQIKAAGKEYAAPQSIKFYAEGGGVGGMGRHPGLAHDDFHAFPEQNYAAQRHMAMRGHDYEKPQTSSLPYHAKHKKAVAVHKDMDTMRLEMIKKAK